MKKFLFMGSSGCLVFVIIFVMMILALFSDDDESSVESESFKEVYNICEQQKIEDIEEFTLNYMKHFEGMGNLESAGQLFIKVSNKYLIDPVLFASIAFHESQEGTASAIETHNNPFGVQDENGNLMKFESLEEGIVYMGEYLKTEFIDKGMFSVNQMAGVLAPTGEENDPNNLNADWIPKVKSYAERFGGFVMNCESIEFGNGEFALPIPDASVNSNYGERIDPFTNETSFHKGIDFACIKGDPIYSAEEGTVAVAVHSGDGAGYGHHVVLDHGGKLTLYGHMTDVLINEGETIARSQQIGTCGSTGRSTGSHLHFEVQLTLFGERIDPTQFFSTENGGTKETVPTSDQTEQSDDIETDTGTGSYYNGMTKEEFLEWKLGKDYFH